MNEWYRLSADETVERLKSDAVSGLSDEEAARRLAEHGPNELVDRGMKSPWLILWEQLTGIMVVILIIAAVISVFLHEYIDASVIMIIVVINAVLGFTQEYRAEKAMAALKRLATPTVRVRRGGRVHEVPARDLVPGDIVVFEAGNIIPADCRLLEEYNFRVQEAALTGESEPVEKDAGAIAAKDISLGDRRNMVYMGTIATYGRGTGMVTDSGMRTELGKIAEMIQTVNREPTPLQKRLEQLGKKLAGVVFMLVGIVMVLGVIRGEEFGILILTAISMAVAAVPEGLPAVVTIALALGAQRMLKQHALIRKLPAVESLGSVTVICSDKTGTLTENKMTAVILDIAGERFDIPTANNDAAADWTAPELVVDNPSIHLLLAGSALCNDAILKVESDSTERFQAIGDPTEGALVVAAARFDMDKYLLDKVFPRTAELPFDSERKRMSTIHRFPSDTPENLNSLRSGWIEAIRDGSPSPYVAFTKGAVDGMVGLSTRVWVNGDAKPLNDSWRARISAANERMTGDGMRVLGLAFRPLHNTDLERLGESVENELTFVGMIGMIDPARPEAQDSVATCKTAGIRPVMITGDHPLTAAYIARELGIYTSGPVLTGFDVEKMTAAEMERVVEDVNVYARVSPEHKIKIVTALQNRGEIAAMTGDGVNDAPALKKSDIGVAMGITGTDVSKEAADMVLLDDNFATIVAAVKEGRVIFDNIRKFIKYTFTSNSAEIWVMLIAPFFGMPLPLLPLQILWINLLTDGLPGLALAVEQPERNIMRRPPFHPKESIFSRGLGSHIIWVGLLMGAVSLGVGYWYWMNGRADWQTMVFTTLTMSQMAHAFAIRTGNDSLFTIGVFSNRSMFIAVFITFVLQYGVVYIPALQGIFSTVDLPPMDFIVTILMSSVVFWAVEIEKWVLRRKVATGRTIA